MPLLKSHPNITIPLDRLEDVTRKAKQNSTKEQLKTMVFDLMEAFWTADIMATNSMLGKHFKGDLTAAMQHLPVDTVRVINGMYVQPTDRLQLNYIFFFNFFKTCFFLMGSFLYHLLERVARLKGQPRASDSVYGRKTEK